MNSELSMLRILETINSVSPQIQLRRCGNTVHEIDQVRNHIFQRLPATYEDFLATFGAMPDLKLLRDANFSIAAILNGLAYEAVVPRGFLPVAYDPGGMNPEFITLKYSLSPDGSFDNPKVFFTYAEGLSQGDGGRLISTDFIRFVAMGLVESMICPSFRYTSVLHPDISLKYIQICKVINIDQVVDAKFCDLGYRPIFRGHEIPVYYREGVGGGIAVYSRCPKDYAFTLAIGSNALGASAQIREAIAAALKTEIRSAL